MHFFNPIFNPPPFTYIFQTYFGVKIFLIFFHPFRRLFYKPLDSEIEEYHPKATKTLFVGGLNRDVAESAVREMFGRFGEILDVDIKKSPAAAMAAASKAEIEAAKKQCYANVQFTDLASVCRAIRECDGELFLDGAARLKCGFARAVPKKCVWCSGIPETIIDKEIAYEFGRYGKVQDILVLRSKGQALIWFDQVNNYNKKLMLRFQFHERKKLLFREIFRPQTLL